MALEISTIGVKFKYVCETSAGTRPTSGYTEIPDVKNIPDMAMTPNQLDVSNLVDKYKRYIAGQIDAGNDIALTCNMTANLKTVWASAVSAAASAWQSGKSTWFEIAIPNFDSFYFAGIPSEMGLSQIGVDAVMEAQLHIIPNQIVGFAAKHT